MLGSPWDQTVDITLPETDADNPEIERMWAWHRVDRLMDEMRENGSRDNVDEVVRLCEGYSIASEYASFIVLENDAEYQRWKIDRRNATRIERDRAAQQAVRQRLEQLRAQTAQQVGPSKTDDRARGVEVAVNTNADPAVNPASSSSNRGVDVGVPAGAASNNNGGNGGGAVDPLTALAAAGLAGLGWAARRRKTCVT